MRRFSNIDNKFALANNLSLSQVFVYEWILNLPKWSVNMISENKVFYFASKTKACADLPVVTTKANTMHKHYKFLEENGFIELIRVNNKDYIHIILEKSKTWGEFTIETTEEVAAVIKTTTQDQSIQEQVEKPSNPIKEDISNSRKEDFTSEDFLNLWKEARLKFLDKPTHIKSLKFNEMSCFNTASKNYNKEDFITAIKGLFGQKNLFDSCKLRPTHFLENFEQYLDCGHNKIQLYDKGKFNKKSNGDIKFDIN